MATFVITARKTLSIRNDAGQLHPYEECKQLQADHLKTQLDAKKSTRDFCMATTGNQVPMSNKTSIFIRPSSLSHRLFRCLMMWAKIHCTWINPIHVRYTSKMGSSSGQELAKSQNWTWTEREPSWIRRGLVLSFSAKKKATWWVVYRMCPGLWA